MALSLKASFIPSLNLPNKTKSRPKKDLGFSCTCRKKGIHPEIYEDAKVYCNGELVMTTSGTQKEYSVDVWSGNHPFYLGHRSESLVDDDQITKFKRRYGELTDMMEIPVLMGEIIIPPRKKSGKGKGKK